jgi:hypothetical protein
MIRRSLENIEELKKLKKSNTLSALSATAVIFSESELAFSFFSSELNTFLA